MPSERSLKLLLSIGSITIAALAILAARRSESLGDTLIDDQWLLLATMAAALLAGLISLINRFRRADKLIPGWFVALTMAKVASLLSVLLLLIAMAISWLIGSPAAALFFRTLILLIVTFALVSIWAALVLELQRLVRRPSPPAPRSASRLPPPPPGTSRG